MGIMSGHETSTERTTLSVSSSFHHVEAVRRPSSHARERMGKFCMFFRVSREVNRHIRDNKSQWEAPKSSECYSEQGARGILNVMLEEAFPQLTADQRTRLGDEAMRRQAVPRAMRRLMRAANREAELFER